MYIPDGRSGTPLPLLRGRNLGNSFRTPDPDAVLEFYDGAEGTRHAGQPFDDLAAGGLVRQAGRPALRTRRLLPHLDRIELEFHELAAAEGRHRDHAFVVISGGRKAGGAVPEPGIIQVRCERGVREIKHLVVVGGHRVDRLVLEDEVGQAVEDRLPLVDLDATEEMRTGDDVGRRSGIETLLDEL